MGSERSPDNRLAPGHCRPSADAAFPKPKAALDRMAARPAGETGTRFRPRGALMRTETLARYPQIGPVLPALGYDAKQLRARGDDRRRRLRRRRHRRAPRARAADPDTASTAPRPLRAARARAAYPARRDRTAGAARA